MPAAGVVLPLIAFVAVAWFVVYVLRRAAAVATDARQDYHLRSASLDVAGRADLSLTESLVVIDAVRRRETDPDGALPSVEAAADAVERYGEEAEAIAAAAGAGRLHRALVDDLARAGRAIDLIEHGCHLLARGGLERHPEGETSVKRGYLNLLHAREAIREHASEIRRESVIAPLAPLWRRRAR